VSQSGRGFSCDLDVGGIQEYQIVRALVNLEKEGGSSQVYLGSPQKVISHLLDRPIDIIFDLLGDTKELFLGNELWSYTALKGGGTIIQLEFRVEKAIHILKHLNLAKVECTPLAPIDRIFNLLRRDEFLQSQQVL
jgi:hypothetical protein